MDFKDCNIDLLNPYLVDDFLKLILIYFCGKSFSPKDIDQEKKNLLEKLIQDLTSTNLNYEQFNEILLLLNQNRISKAFFNYFFQEGNLNLEILKKGIIKFRGLSILNFGNFKFTYKRFSRLKKDEIDLYFGEFMTPTNELEEYFRKRPEPIINLKKINKEYTWFTGYISSTLIEKESKYLEEILKLCNNPEKYESFKNLLIKTNKEMIKSRQIANQNINTYLVWDYLDVYIATSMRKSCEFEETYDIIEKIFINPKIIDLKLRYFDPTQSYCNSTRDKGLIEGLMLKRAKCTIYMIQESDTFGKDSELAATLAQKKPVIAFIPDYDKDTLCEKIKNYPLEYIKERIYIFKAEKEFDEIEILKELNKNSFQLNELLNNYLNEYDNYRLEQPFSLWSEKEEQFKSQNRYFQEICKILSIATKKYWDRRARILQKSHPLGMQIDINSGVSNGVLVIRDIDKCVDILKGILTNSLSFEIKHFEDGYTGLIESKSESIYRIVTDNELLTNSFWNFFYPI